jgi:hypothetical protein
VFLAVVLIYVVIMSIRLKHNSRELEELRREVLAARTVEPVDRVPEEGTVAPR